jgi:hypothetical protein
MAKKMPMGRRFQPGNNANPIGALAHNQEMKAIKHMSSEELANIMKAVLSANTDDYEVMAKAPGSIFKKMLCSVIDKIIERGDAAAMNALLDRILGKIKESVDVKQEITVNVRRFDGTKY